jgi:hypothetical protein
MPTSGAYGGRTEDFLLTLADSHQQVKLILRLRRACRGHSGVGAEEAGGGLLGGNSPRTGPWERLWGSPRMSRLSPDLTHWEPEITLTCYLLRGGPEGLGVMGPVHLRLKVSLRSPRGPLGTGFEVGLSVTAACDCRL